MRIVLQRVLSGAVTIEGNERRQVAKGFVGLVGFCHGDTEKEADYLASKMVELRIFEDENGQMNLSLLETGGECLLVPNFTLYANAKKGRRPSFIEAAHPQQAEPIYRHFAGKLKEVGVNRVEMGEFGASMEVTLTNDGPVTIILDSDVIMPK